MENTPPTTIANNGGLSQIRRVTGVDCGRAQVLRRCLAYSSEEAHRLNRQPS